MAGTVVSASKGVLDSVVAKLDELIGDNCAGLIGVSRDIRFLRDELPAMNALLENLEKLEDTHELDPLVKVWRDQVREMTYDIEDCIDNFMDNTEGADAKAGFIDKVSHFLQTWRARLETAWQINDLKTRLQEINERCTKRYKYADCTSSTTSVVVDPRISVVYKEAASLVGIDGPKEELINQVIHDQGQQLKVVTIVGFGGLGKTTLANAVYQEVGGQFNCEAFVSVSQKADMTKLLNSMLSEFKLYPSHACELQDHINSLRKYLLDKRYFIVVDDLWVVQDWNIITCAFPQNNLHSRVIVTTRNENVARACSYHGYIYNLKPLSDRDSKELFFNRIFGSEDACPPQFTEVSCEIMKKCGGLPLAVITMASMLACQPTRLKEQWEDIRNSLATKFATDSTLEDMMYILDLSYKSLPRHLKACFLYLGTYPEDHKISRVDLIRRWVAENFVTNSDGRDVWAVAESHFNELVNRSMIQPACEDDDIMISYCRVHDMMLCR